MPAIDISNSSSHLFDKDWILKQRRYYGPNGFAEEDIDYKHTDDGTHTFPHRHRRDANMGCEIEFIYNNGMYFVTHNKKGWY